MNFLRSFGQQLRKAYGLLAANDPLRLAGATAFFTLFALPPILLILIQLLSLLFNRREISRQLMEHLSGILGRDSVLQLITTIRGFRGLADNLPLTILGFILLIFIATTLFKVIQSSFNQLWRIRKLKGKKFQASMRTRLKSGLVIIFTCVLFLLTLLTESLQAIFGKYVAEVLPGASFMINGTVAIIISILVVWIWFTLLFRYLPDGRPAWRVAFAGALLTSLLFNGGKYLLRWVLPSSNIGVVYGASGSLVLLLLFLFYSSLILYYGAAFTKVWSIHRGEPIQPMPHACHYDLTDTVEEATGREK